MLCCLSGIPGRLFFDYKKSAKNPQTYINSVHSHYSEPTKRKSYNPAWLSGNHIIYTATAIVLTILKYCVASTFLIFKNPHEQRVFTCFANKIRRKIRKTMTFFSFPLLSAGLFPLSAHNQESVQWNVKNAPLNPVQQQGWCFEQTDLS